MDKIAVHSWGTIHMVYPTGADFTRMLCPPEWDSGVQFTGYGCVGTGSPFKFAGIHVQFNGPVFLT